MKQLFLLSIFVMILVSISLGQTNKKNKNKSEPKQTELSEQQLIIQIEEELRKAKIENNVKIIDEILAQNFSGTNQFGHVRNKDQSKVLFSNFKIRALTIDSASVLIVNDTTATVKGLQTENNVQMSFVRNYVKQKGKWHILSSIQKIPEFQSLQGMGSYRIIGFLQGAEGVAISLLKNVGNNQNNMNAAIVKDGKFLMEGKAIEFPEMVFLTTPGKRERASFYLENSEITITGHLDSLSKVKVTGSKTQNEYSTLLKSLEASRGNFERTFKEMTAARQSKDTVQIAQIQKEIDLIRPKVKAIQKDFIMNNPQSYATPVILQGIANTLSSAEIESILNAMDPGVARTPVALQIKERVNALKFVDIGQKAPDFTLNDVKGNSVSLSSKIGTKLLLIDFWAAWCGPCRLENPNVVKVYNQFKSKGFDILGVSLDRNKEEWIGAIAKDNLRWTQVSDLLYWNSAVAKLYAVNSIPANFLLDQDGKIVAKNIRGEELMIKVKELLGEK